jgi:membrane fusion protein (multidrug efflux system)
MRKSGTVGLSWCLVVLCLLIASGVGCKKKEAKKAEEKTFNVQIREVDQKALRTFVDATGTLTPFDEVTISAEVDGIVKTVSVDEGTVVSKGALMATIDDTDYSQEVKRDEAIVRQAEATLANTRVEFKRKETLYKEELVTSQQFDDVSTKVALTEAEVDRLKAALSLARQKLAKTRIRAPMAGVVKERKVSPGYFLKNGTQLFVLIQPNPIKLQFSVPEKDVGKLKVGQEVILKVDAFPEVEFKGRVSIIYPSLEEKTRTLIVEALVPNDKGALKPGLFARVLLYTGAEKATTVIPVTSILYEGPRVRVFVVEGNRARQRDVRLGSKYGEVMEVVEGVKAGERVVVAGQQSLSEGVKVAVQGAASSTSNVQGSGLKQEGTSKTGANPG